MYFLTLQIKCTTLQIPSLFVAVTHPIKNGHISFLVFSLTKLKTNSVFSQAKMMGMLIAPYKNTDFLASMRAQREGLEKLLLENNSTTNSWENKVVEWQSRYVTFKADFLFRIALTHKSICSNSRMTNRVFKTLGDAVLECLVMSYLFQRYGNALEGDLTNHKKKLVNKQALSRVCTELGLSALILQLDVQRAEQTKQTNLAGALQAVLGALFFDQVFIEFECLKMVDK